MMGRTMIKKSICRAALFSYFINPLFYCSAVFTIAFVSFRFFLVSKFFVAGLGSSDLRNFFSAIPFASIVTVPLLVFRLRDFVKSDSMPFSPFSKYASLGFSAFCVFLLPVALLFSIPLSVGAFGIVEGGQIATGFAGICLFACASCSLAVFVFSAVQSQSVALIVSFALLFGTNFIDVVPLYLDVGRVLSFLCRKFGFSFAFDSFSKGILDSRSIMFYALSSCLWITLASFFENRRLGKKTSSLTKVLVALILIFVSIGSEKCFFRIDFTKSKLYSVSSTTKNLVAKIDEPLRITYFSSRELLDVYPQADDVLEFLKDISLSSSSISLTVKRISSRDDSQKIAEYGIRGQQVKSDKGTKTEYITVYSAILIQYLDKNSLIPFAASIENLEYDLCQRIRTLVFESGQRVYVVLGNNLSQETRYEFVEPWLTVRGFSVSVLDDLTLIPALDDCSPRDEIVVLGSKSLSAEQCAAIERAVMRGVPAVIATSPYSVDIENDWSISKNPGDNLIPALNSWGFAFAPSLVQDISCVPIVLESADGASEYQTMNYPLWVSALPQDGLSFGGTFFWASPIALYGSSRATISSSAYAWQQDESDSPAFPFVISPFTVQKSAKEAGKENGQFALCATTDSVSGFYQTGKTSARVTVVSGELFVDSVMTGYISSERAGDFRNFDFLVSELLRLSGNSDIALLMEKNGSSKQLFKITDEREFKSARFYVLFIHFALLPALLIGLFVFVQVKRK